MEGILDYLTRHFRPKTIEIAERFKIFKRSQREDESATDFIAELRALAKTCNFAAYLETAIRDQFVVGSRTISASKSCCIKQTCSGKGRVSSEHVDQ